MPELLLINAAVVLAGLTLLWLASLPLRDVSIVDVAWGPGFAVVAWISWGLAPTATAAIVPAVLTTVWALRLAGYLAWRKRGEGEDRRYRAMRDKHNGRFWWLSLLTVFWLQGGLMWLISLPLQLGQLQPWAAPLVPLAWIGGGLWGIGLVFETVGDWQLARFKANPANQGQVLDRGLWRYTRHPNYFGDFLVWWGLGLLCLAAGAPWWALAGPVVMSILLMRVSGVTLLEKSLRQRKPGYEDYVRRTSAFFPLPPSKPAA